MIEKQFTSAYKRTNIRILSEKTNALLAHCTICPRKCGVNRLKGELGHCKTGKDVVISSYGPHFGEENELVGQNGSGTIFFAYCNLNCVFCQNYDISQHGHGDIVNSSDLAKIMLNLQNMGCHNINLVSPTHIVPQFLQALAIAKDKGLNLPIVYNSGGYDSVKTLKLLDGVIDVYMPDAKYGSDEMGEKYSNARPVRNFQRARRGNQVSNDSFPDTKFSNGVNYWDTNKLALKEMYRQVGDLKVNKDSIAERGLLVRHLVLPNRIAGSFEVLRFIAQEISLNTYINIMEQYHPCYNASKFPELSRRITSEEYQEVIDYAIKIGLILACRQDRLMRQS